ncbi:MAG TPA: response regulator, partial [Candidatus Solibacter sp.]|nr:response regulator [Candidatus Solibacter sp.]
MSPVDGRRIRFGEYEADLVSGELRKSGKRLPLQEQPFQVLAALLDHPGDVVTREFLRERLWPGQPFVDFDQGLNTAINKLRDALGDSAANPRFIETLPRRGYRYIGPAVRTEDAARASAAPTSPAMEHDQLPTKILVVDDHMLIREALRGVLDELVVGATLLEAPDGRSAMQLIEQHHDLALVLLDLNLPDLDGFALLADLRERHPTMSIVVLSALQDRATVTKALKGGALGFIPKSANRDVMVQALRLVFAGGIYIPPQILEANP